MGRELIESYFSGLGSIFMLLFVPESILMFGVLTALVVSRRLRRRRPGGGGGGGPDLTLRPDSPPGVGRSLSAGNPPAAFRTTFWLLQPVAPQRTQDCRTPDSTSAPNTTAV